MPRAFSSIAYTPSVRRAQERYGTRRSNAGFDHDPEARNKITARDADFIEEIETFFMASVGETGWPYVQHRGGPRGFLKVLDAGRLGFADFRGNGQYISAGNFDNDSRVMLLLMDFARRGRLKIWGRVQIVDAGDDPALVASLRMGSYRALIERAYVINVEALDFNCPQHIVQRFSEQELVQMAQSADGRAALTHLLGLAPQAGAAATAAAAAATTTGQLGNGPLPLRITGLRQLTPTIRAYTLAHADGRILPAVTAGAHLAVPVRLDGQAGAVRNYSIVAVHGGEWEIAVMRRDDGGGSAALQRDYQLGTVVRCEAPTNDFVLHEDARPAVLIAGGIGITAILPMAWTLQERGVPFALHYAGRARHLMAYREQLPPGAALYAGAEGARMDIDQLVASAPADALLYVCGPERLLDAVGAAIARHGIDPDRLRMERFDPPVGHDNRPVTLQLRRSGLTVEVAADQNLLDAIEAAGVAVPSDCRVGNCGTCAVKVLEGVPEHRDSVLTRNEREMASLFCPCVSRARSATLVLDL